MNHLAVAGAGLHPDMIVLFQDDGIEPGQGELRATASPTAPAPITTASASKLSIVRILAVKAAGAGNPDG
jgi:hypothetical protein